MIGYKTPNRVTPLRLQACVLLCAMVVFPIVLTYGQDADAVGARLKASGERLRAASEAGKFNSGEEALAKWHQIKERFVKEAVAAGEISGEEADILRREMEKAEAAEMAEAASAPATGRATATQILSYLDKNGDGKISKDEASEELKPNFQFIDTNGDGAIDVKEAQVMANYANQAQDK